MGQYFRFYNITKKQWNENGLPSNGELKFYPKYNGDIEVYEDLFNINPTWEKSDIIIAIGDYHSVMNVANCTHEILMEYEYELKYGYDYYDDIDENDCYS